MPESKHRRNRGEALSRRAGSASARSSTRSGKKRPNKLYVVASAVIAVLVIAGFALGGLAGGGTSGSSSGSSSQFVEGIGERQPIESSNHQNVGTDIVYNSFPPTSGDHYPPEALQRCGFYEDGMRDEVAVHHLEHGNIVVNYNLPDSGQVDQLRNVMGDIDIAKIWGIARSYDKIPEGQVALAAWGVLDRMDGVDEGRITQFFEVYAGSLGPESITCR